MCACTVQSIECDIISGFSLFSVLFLFLVVAIWTAFEFETVSYTYTERWFSSICGWNEYEMKREINKEKRSPSVEFQSGNRWTYRKVVQLSNEIRIIFVRLLHISRYVFEQKHHGTQKKSHQKAKRRSLTWIMEAYKFGLVVSMI